MSGCFFFDPFASTARLADAGGIAAPRLLEFLLPPSDRRAAQSRDDRQVLDPSSTVGCRPEAGKQSSPSLVQGGDQKIDGPMLLDDLAPETSLAIRTTTDMDRWGWGPGFHGSPLSCERKEVSLIVPRNQSTYSWPAPNSWYTKPIGETASLSECHRDSASEPLTGDRNTFSNAQLN